ncbi:hypothetical protein [Mangrovibacterium diazotrophicum]|uniref:Uncharacterized protein n=1 Tax=Mangrovibacterium diazotrophicum TaxID=1261403 RepID=A0A419W7E5_9BACT|nr:hypothetical protein [Mangrovibacterium diazotrophicum]RKD91401.1 hypothetical protein BC643_1754 [Mangrovibacterium diazotrophicum]
MQRIESLFSPFFILRWNWMVRQIDMMNSMDLMFRFHSNKKENDPNWGRSISIENNAKDVFVAG